MAGVRNIVAPQGTAFTSDHARILKRYADEVVLCFDSDSAGQNAAARVLDSLLGAGLAIRVAAIPAPHDPDSFIKERGGGAFHELIENAQGFFDFYLNRLCDTNDLTSDKGRMTVVKEMAEAVRKTASAVLFDTYAQKTAQRLGVSADSVRAEFKKLGRAPAVSSERTEDATEEPAQSPPSEREFWLLRFLLLEDEHLDWVAQHFRTEWIEHPLVRRVVSSRLAAHAAGSWHGVPALIDELNDPQASSLVSQAVTQNAVRSDVSRNLSETMRLLRNDYCDRQLATLKIKLSQPGLPESDTVQILKAQAELRRLKQQPLIPADGASRLIS
jgi:DNA primase